MRGEDWTHTHTCSHSFIHSYTHIHTHIHTHTFTHTHIHTHIFTRTYSHPFIHTHVHNPSAIPCAISNTSPPTLSTAFLALHLERDCQSQRTRETLCVHRHQRPMVVCSLQWTSTLKRTGEQPQQVQLGNTLCTQTQECKRKQRECGGS